MLTLPTPDGRLEAYALSGDPLIPRAPRVPLTRLAYAAAHVVSDPLRERNPWDTRPALDWEATLRLREGLWDQGLHLAEAMDTAQRGMGLDWPSALELVGRTMRAARAHPMKPRVASGAGTDHLPLSELTTEAAVVAAYETQMEAVEATGSRVILMASRALPAMGAGPDVYARIYGRLLEQAREPVILHWLGEMFDPSLKGYWGCSDLPSAIEQCSTVIEASAHKVEGIKISLLDQEIETAFRARLPPEVKMYTGDDFHYAPLIAGDGARHSHALLGIFSAIAPAASQALEALAGGDRAAYDALLAPTVPLSREIFRAPTRFYKAGIAVLSWLNGQQAHFVMPAGLQSARDITHYAQVYRLADRARLLRDPALAERRMATLLALHGIG